MTPPSPTEREARIIAALFPATHFQFGAREHSAGDSGGVRGPALGALALPASTIGPRAAPSGDSIFPSNSANPATNPWPDVVRVMRERAGRVPANDGGER